MRYFVGMGTLIFLAFLIPILSHLEDVREYPTLTLTQSYEGDWDCQETNQFGTTQECIAYWDSLSELVKNEGRYEMLQKLNRDGYLSDTLKQFIFEIEGIWLFDEGA